MLYNWSSLIKRYYWRFFPWKYLLSKHHSERVCLERKIDLEKVLSMEITFLVFLTLSKRINIFLWWRAVEAKERENWEILSWHELLWWKFIINEGFCLDSQGFLWSKFIFQQLKITQHNFHNILISNFILKVPYIAKGRTQGENEASKKSIYCCRIKIFIFSGGKKRIHKSRCFGYKYSKYNNFAWFIGNWGRIKCHNENEIISFFPLYTFSWSTEFDNNEIMAMGIFSSPNGSIIFNIFRELLWETELRKIIIGNKELKVFEVKTFVLFGWFSWIFLFQFE